MFELQLWQGILHGLCFQLQEQIRFKQDSLFYFPHEFLIADRKTFRPIFTTKTVPAPPASWGFCKIFHSNRRNPEKCFWNWFHTNMFAKYGESQFRRMNISVHWKTIQTSGMSLTKQGHNYGSRSATTYPWIADGETSAFGIRDKASILPFLWECCKESNGIFDSQISFETNNRDFTACFLIAVATA